MKTKLPIILFLIGAVLSANGYAGYSGAFLRIGTSARSVAMGSAYTAALDAGFAAYHNPAGTAFITSPRISVIHHIMPLDRQLTATGFSTSLPPTAGISLALIRSATTDIDGRTTAGEHTATLSTSENAVYLGFAQRIKPWFSVGINVKVLFQNLPINEEKLSGSGSGFDIGFMMKLPQDRQIGFVVQDLNSGYTWKTNTIFDDGNNYEDRFPTMYRFGISTPLKMLYLVADAGVAADGGTYLAPLYRVGIEYPYQDHYFLRAGFGNNRAAFGAGMKYRFRHANDAAVDYAVTIDAGAGLSHILTFAFEF